MGVRHLFSFISKTVHNGLLPVNMERDIQSYKRRNGSNQIPTIIIHLKALLSLISLNDHELLLGGRYNIYIERARFIFSQLKSLEINLVFFVDGRKTQEDKLTASLRRRNEDYNNDVIILHAIDDGVDLSGDLSSYKLAKLSTFFHDLKDMAKEYGELHISILNECHQEMVSLAAARGALAIITDDTDFLIFEGKWRVWSGKKLDFKTLTTMQYNKEALRATLKLSPQQMVLLASLGGNTIVKYRTVEEFHRRISNHTNKFRAIANFIRKLNTLPPNLNDLDKNTLVNSVFHPDDRDEGMIALQKSLNFYCLVDMQVEHKNVHPERLAREVKNFIYPILANKVYISMFEYCDLKSVFTPYYEVIKPLFCRIMGVLLQNEVNEDVSRTFYFKLDHDKLFEPVKLFPEYPTCKVPSAVELLYHPYGEDPTLDELRWNLLCFIISQKLNSNLLREIPKENLGTVLTLFHLVELKEISEDEADCVLLSCNPTPEILNGLDFNEVKQINGRDARMAFLYAQLHNLMDNCICAVGLREYSTLLKFDGLCFHTLRKRWISDGEQLKRAMMEPLKCLRIYSEDFKIL